MVTMVIRQGGLKLKQAAVEKALSFSRRTKASTFALMTKIVGSLAILARRRADERLSVLGVIP